MSDAKQFYGPSLGDRRALHPRVSDPPSSSLPYHSLFRLPLQRTALSMDSRQPHLLPPRTEPNENRKRVFAAYHLRARQTATSRERSRSIFFWKPLSS